MKVKVGTGVLDKNGDPWETGTMHLLHSNGFLSPVKFNWRNMSVFVSMKRYRELIVVDHDNVQYTFTKEPGE